ncbi:hypothetical protein COW36_03600 [bacterium (Candidatus Blackallbacteria) CG17_big_fil_post_rev_8_21_14_2_50_48_46]|uniref:Uncharacterized protein n=1 Tax=bacterium (Candidatus Blackallbacteria) CG17_big_fil_post_rev_8_21_14_2_50_48_46 TaxID=2014261 RepID=A0A2M7G8F5_9BACT|nr:MAG: hypothetical protein COW64_20770 [bacterium (Candidatus Blackallbacteria) CG18_big_fil_WC_8_21_14_2_50_49_26]PIW18389.1 MAG: hypothetical protein COW36_03600 [bacterium (Candidatus Blackallbacteria) CG17_big_fil_post_rev_8_21_14_2_50_48_46]PIW50548.1 MAG: hypothetical protein COW20_02025 [bacterium (Candidatus Blackallbacteria) CG13_big_fil_rev_8_21_14_2_50_49_14]
MHSAQIIPLAAALIVALLVNFYLSFLVQTRYGGQWGAGFYLPLLVVFSLPCLVGVGFPVWLILVAPASAALKAILFFSFVILNMRLLMRITPVILNKRFQPPKAKDQSPHNGET